MRIWIINYYAETPQSVSNPRYIKLARCFMDFGHEVITFNASKTANTIVEQNIIGEQLIERTYGDYKYVHVNAPDYVGNGVKRMVSIRKFASIIKKNSKRFPKPDVILQNIHPPFDYPIVRLAKKIKCKYIAEAWDLWPADFVTFGLIKEGNPALKVAYVIEKQYYYHADSIIFTFEGAIDYLKKKGWTTETGGKIDLQRVYYINNGIDLAQFDKDKVAYPRSDGDLNNPNIYKIVYLGSINIANQVQTLIDAAALLKDNSKYRFFIYGDGAHREFLEQYVNDNHISNVVFKEKRISFAECAWVVSQSTVNIMNYEKNFGWMGVSSGKMFQYLAAGKPIVCNIDIAYDDVITNNNLGVARDLKSAEEFAAEIQRIAELSREEYDAMCNRVRKVAKCFDYKVLAAKELKVLESAYRTN